MPAYRDEPDALDEIPPLSDNETDIDAASQDGNMHVRSPSIASSHGIQVPIWLQESAKSFKFRWVPLSLRKAGRATVKWVKGPMPPRQLSIKPIFPRIQEAPIRLLDRYVPKRRHRICLLIAYLATWFLIWSLMLSQLASSGHIEGYGRPQNTWCGANFWNDGNGCGLNGNGCRPFSSSSYVFKCPANCLVTHLRQPHAVGNESHIYTTLVVGGPSSDNPAGKAIYRGDSFICQAAIHAGVISAETGGCGVAYLVGEHSGFEASTRNGVKSFGFPASFPRNYYFPDLSGYDAQCPADSRWGIFAVTAVTLVILSIFTTSPGVLFFSTFFVLILHVGLISDPPNKENFPELLSTSFGRLLPAVFVAVILYRVAAVPLLTGLTAQIEKTVLYLGFCFTGALNNYTFAPLIPLERLTPHDLKEPGAPLALATVVTIIIAIVVSQIHFIRISGNMPKYLAIYCAMGLTLILLILMPQERLRIHHYILAMIFMPGTFTKNRGCLAYQGLLLGLFVNGVARWGWDSIIQTPAALGEDSGGHPKTWWGSAAPNVTAIVPQNAANITFSWGMLPLDSGIDGVSILINDVERWRGYVDNELYWDQTQVTLERQRHWIGTHEPEFYRFAWMNGGSTGRYSRTGVWDENDIWHAAPARRD